MKFGTLPVIYFIRNRRFDLATTSAKQNPIIFDTMEHREGNEFFSQRTMNAIGMALYKADDLNVVCSHCIIQVIPRKKYILDEIITC